MKRSEMINILTVKLLGLMVNEYGVGMKMAKDDAEEILSAIEKAGMLPPYRDVFIEGHLCDETTWEPE